MLLAGNILLMVSILTVIGTFLSDLVLLWIDPPDSGEGAMMAEAPVRADQAAAEDERQEALYSQRRLTRIRFLRHKAAVVSGVLLCCFYLVATFADRSEYLSGLIDDPRIAGPVASILGCDYNYAASDGNYYVGDTK